MMAYSEPDCSYGSIFCVPPPPPPPPPRRSTESNSSKNHSIPLIAILLFCALGTAFLVVSYLTYVRRYYSTPNNSRRRNRNPPAVDGQEDFVDENRGPMLDHPIWNIRTVGLQQSVIDSISVFKYKGDNGLTEGTGCSVCLSEFEEDETLRLLPKCSHAFHILCIDTWLTSHKNCPLCRAPIVCENAHLSEPGPNLDHLGLREETRVENLETVGTLGIDRLMGDLPSQNFGGFPSEQGTAPEILSKNLRFFNTQNCEIRVLSDLALHRTGVEELELQPVRRSISLDASSASMIYYMVNNPHLELEGSSSTRLVEVKKLNSEKNVKSVRRNLSISRLMKSSSMRFSLQNGPVSMKRSFSSSGKFSLPRKYSRSQESILPL